MIQKLTAFFWNSANCWMSGFLLLCMENWLGHWDQSAVVNGTTSGSWMITKGALQNLILGPVFFNVFIDVLDARVELIINFADTGMGSAADCLKRQKAFRRALVRLEHWVMLKFSKSKCWILHLGQSNIGQIINCERSGWRVALQKGIWGWWLAAVEYKSTVCPVTPILES